MRHRERFGQSIGGDKERGSHGNPDLRTQGGTRRRDSFKNEDELSGNPGSLTEQAMAVSNAVSWELPKKKVVML